MDPFVRDALAELKRRLEKLIRRGLYQQAIATAEEICQLIRQQLGENHPLLLYSLVALGDLHAEQRQFDSAERYYEQAIQLGTKSGRADPRLLADALAKQAQTKTALGKQSEAAGLAGRLAELSVEPAASAGSAPAGPPKPAAPGLSARGGAGRTAQAAEPVDELVCPVVDPLPPLGPRGPLARLADAWAALGRLFRRRDVVQTSVFAPPQVAPSQLFFVQVFLHQPQQYRVVKGQAREIDRRARLRARQGLRVQVARGTELTVHLTLPGLDVDQPHERIVWRGQPEAARLPVRVPPDHQGGDVLGTVTVSMARVPVGHVKFLLTITPAAGPTAPATMDSQPVAARRYRQAFVSYASQDRAEVLKRVAMLRVAGIRVFQDVLSLEPGERWEQRLYQYIDQSDLFLLFWSSAAQASEWVRQEVRYAWQRKHHDDTQPPEILPVILEAPPPLPPPAELAHLHFNDCLMYLAQPPAAGSPTPPPAIQ